MKINSHFKTQDFLNKQLSKNITLKKIFEKFISKYD